MIEWHALSLKEVFSELNSVENGLSEEEANERLVKFGENKLERKEKISLLKIFLDQFKSFLVLLLIFAALISFGLAIFSPDGEYLFDAILIMLILLANGFFGFLQDFKAEKSIEALQKMAVPYARVIRNGKEKSVLATRLVRGDILLLEEGDIIPADARVIDATNLAINESALTGESLPVSKKTIVLKKETILPEKENLLFMNTAVVRGKAKAVIFSTGMQTEIGKIAASLEKIKETESPFEKEINALGKKLAIGIIALIVIIAVIQLLLHSAGFLEIFLTSISLMVAAVPEGLPAVVTLALAIGVRKMVKKNSLARKLSTVESLGSVDVICSDKTGTMTENKMIVREIFAFGEIGKRLMLKAGLFCNNIRLVENELKGDPTEKALVESAIKAGYKFEQKIPAMYEIAFSSERKMMSTVHNERNNYFIYSKGAIEVIIEKCGYFFEEGKTKKLTAEKRKEIMEKNNAFANNALRVIALAFKEIKGNEFEKEMKKEGHDEFFEKDLVFLGLQGMLDPPRKEVKFAIEECRIAGIQVKMITGDNALTAKAIGKELGFEGNVLTGVEIEKMSIEELKKAVEEVDIFARVDPLHKMKIVEALHANKHVVAMTGDGVNDAPALKDADVGISMGIRGTEVAKQASDMVLLDDNFVTIKEAIAEGRGIFDNIRKFVNYLLSANAAEVLIVFLSSVFGLGLILTAVHLLWINLLTDGLPALALGVDPHATDIMKRKPRNKNEGIISREMTYSVIALAGLMTICVLAIIFLNLNELNNSEPFEKIQTIAFTSIVILELAKIGLIKVQYNSPILSNKWLWIAAAGSLALQLLVLYTPLNVFFKVIPLGIKEWNYIIGGLIVFLIAGTVIVKAISKRNSNK